MTLTQWHAALFGIGCLAGYVGAEILGAVWREWRAHRRFMRTGSRLR